MEEMKGNYDERARRGVKYPLFGFVVTILVLLSSMSMVSGSSQCAQPYMVRGDNITITSPTGGAVILHNSTVTITWEYTGDSHVDYYEVYIDDVGNPHYLENNITVTLQDGKHWFGVVAYNGSGEIARKIGSAEVNFTVDAEPPILVIRDPWESEVISESTVLVDWDNGTFQYPQYDGIPTDHYEVKLDNSSWINVGLHTLYNFMNVEDGKHTVYVREYDIYGLNTTNMVNFTVDAHPPILTILSPEQNSFVNKSAVMVKWEAHDGNGIDHYQIAVDYGPANNEWLYLSNQTNFYVFTNLTEGTHTVYVEAYESAPPIQPDAPEPQPKGYYSLKTVSFTVDTTPPTLRINPPTYLNLSSVRINWVGDDNIGVSRYEIKMDNSSWVNVGLNTSYTFTGVHGGNHIVYVRAYDLANNMVEKELSLAPPSFNFYALNSTDGMVGWEHITLEIKEYRGMELTKMRIVIVNATSGNNTPIVDTGWLNYTEFYNITLNKKGEYKITVSVKDTANNMATVSHELYVALSPPVIKQVWLNQNLTTNRTNATIHAEDPAGGLQFGYAVDGVFIRWYNSSTIPIYLPYKSGNYSITLYVKDRFGHETTQSTWVFVNLTAKKEGNGGTTNGGNQNTNPSGGAVIVSGCFWIRTLANIYKFAFFLTFHHFHLLLSLYTTAHPHLTRTYLFYHAIILI